jgi:uncharacterized protein YqhQ
VTDETIVPEQEPTPERVEHAPEVAPEPAPLAPPAPELSDAEIERRFAAPVGHTHIGGQALLEGVMMRGKLNWAVAVRAADGSIHVEEHDLAPKAATGWRKRPILRGVYAMYETLALSMRAFGIAASMAGETEEEQLSSTEIAWTMVLGVVLAVGVFIIAPALLTNVVAGSSATANPLVWNGVDGVLRLAVFFLYIWGIGRVPDISRVFAYHGAEHKSIHAYEHGIPLQPRYIQRYDTLHIRCGTAFLLMVMVISILVFSLLPGKIILGLWGITNGTAIIAFNIVSRILLLPLVAGLAYEVTVKWAGNHSENPFVKVLLWPGMQLQRLTTREPDDDMVEVAVAALQAVADREARDSAGPAGADTAEAVPLS